jgi:tetratricopeptide (TPR) repeat protein
LLARLLANQNEPAKAEPEIREEIRLRPDAALAYSDLGMILSMQGKLTEAEAACQKAIAISEELLARLPSMYRYRIDLAEGYRTLGTVTCQRGKWERGLELSAKAVALLESVPAQDSSAARSREVLIMILNWRINQLLALKRYPEAIRDSDLAIGLQKSLANQAAFGNRFQIDRAVALARSGDYARAIIEADKILQVDQDPETLYDVACLYAVASGKITGEEKLTERFSTQVISLLSRAHAAGFFAQAKNLDLLNEDSDLEPLRSREDFKTFLAAVTRQVEEKVRQQSSREATTRKSATTAPAKR